MENGASICAAHQPESAPRTGVLQSMRRSGDAHIRDNRRIIALGGISSREFRRISPNFLRNRLLAGLPRRRLVSLPVSSRDHGNWPTDQPANWSTDQLTKKSAKKSAKKDLQNMGAEI
ncbi:MAG TPA: hypothetical protein VM223_21000 [Planctomycetota bacterium]|nr:hypothetical protein [Planctomycetota bacterium]